MTRAQLATLTLDQRRAFINARLQTIAEAADEIRDIAPHLAVRLYAFVEAMLADPDFLGPPPAGPHVH